MTTYIHRPFTMPRPMFMTNALVVSERGVGKEAPTVTDETLSVRLQYMSGHLAFRVIHGHRNRKTPHPVRSGKLNRLSPS